MTVSNKNDDYEIALIDNDVDARLCAQLLAEEFASSNAFVILRKPTAQELFDRWLWPLMTEVLNEKLSFLVRNRSTKEIVAAIIANDFYLYSQKHSPNSTSNNPSADLFAEMRDHFLHHEFPKKLEVNMVLSLSAGATRSQLSGKGIAFQLRAHICDYAHKTLGFHYAFIQTSHPATRYIYTKKMNGKELMIVDPATWLWKKKDDEPSLPFKDYVGEPAVNVLVQFKYE